MYKRIVKENLYRDTGRTVRFSISNVPAFPRRVDPSLPYHLPQLVPARALARCTAHPAPPVASTPRTQKIKTVIVNGRVLDRKTLDSLLTEAENAVKNR